MEISFVAHCNYKFYEAQDVLGFGVEHQIEAAPRGAQGGAPDQPVVLAEGAVLDLDQILIEALLKEVGLQLLLDNGLVRPPDLLNYFRNQANQVGDVLVVLLKSR